MIDMQVEVRPTVAVHVPGKNMIVDAKLTRLMVKTGGTNEVEMLQARRLVVGINEVKVELLAWAKINEAAARGAKRRKTVEVQGVDLPTRSEMGGRCSAYDLRASVSIAGDGKCHSRRCRHEQRVTRAAASHRQPMGARLVSRRRPNFEAQAGQVDNILRSEVFDDVAEGVIAQCTILDGQRFGATGLEGNGSRSCSANCDKIEISSKELRTARISAGMGELQVSALELELTGPVDDAGKCTRSAG